MLQRLTSQDQFSAANSLLPGKKTYHTNGPSQMLRNTCRLTSQDQFSAANSLLPGKKTYQFRPSLFRIFLLIPRWPRAA